MADFHWKIRRSFGAGRFSDGLVVQDGTRGLLRLSVSRASTREATSGEFGFLGPLSAACASEGIRRDTGIISWLHWPNLVTIEGRVVAKTSLSFGKPPEPDAKAQVSIGVLVNCFTNRPTSFPSVLPDTSILEALGVEIDINLLRDKILHALDWYFAEWERGMHRKLVDRMEPTISWLGRDVEVRKTDGKVLKGRAKGLDDQGSLWLQQRGRVHTIPAASVDFVQAVK